MIMDHSSNMQDVAKSIETPDINIRIAARVRALRGALGMSLEDLSGRCSVSRSMLSLIERGESSPTAIVLDKLAAGLGVPLAALFDDPAVPASPISRRNDRGIWRDPESGYLRRNISPSNFPSSIHLVEVVLPPGARVAYESASLHDIDQQVWVQEGRIEITVGQTTHHLGEDDCLAMRLGEPMAFANRTRKPARYIVAIAGERPRAPHHAAV